MDQAESNKTYDLDTVRAIIETATRHAVNRADHLTRSEIDSIATDINLTQQDVSRAIASLEKQSSFMRRPAWKSDRFQAWCVGTGIFSAASAMSLYYLADRISQPPLVFVGFASFALLSVAELNAAFRLKGPGRYVAYHLFNACIWGSWGIAAYMLAPRDFGGVGTAWFLIGATVGTIVMRLRDRFGSSDGDGLSPQQHREYIPVIARVAKWISGIWSKVKTVEVAWKIS